MLKTRIMTAAVLIILAFAVVLYLPESATVFALTALVLAGAWEWSAFLRAPSQLVRIIYVAIIGALLYLTWRITQTPEGRDSVLLVAVVWWIVALLWVMLAPRRVTPWIAAIAGILALVPAWAALVRLRLEVDRGAEWVLFVLVLVWMADVGAFFVGRKFGRVRLAPEVSPGKTWEGVFGGIAFSAIVAVLGAYWFSVPWMVFVPLCLATVAFSIVGDLTESLLKRFAGVKDSGSLFPGHGGVMDRIDSVTAAAPILFFGLIALGFAA